MDKFPPIPPPMGEDTATIRSKHNSAEPFEFDKTKQGKDKKYKFFPLPEPSPKK